MKSIGITGPLQHAIPIDRVKLDRYKVDSNGCHVWTGAMAYNGYGLCHGGRRNNASRSGITLRVHRVAYEQANGPIPSGLVIDHLCRNRACLNPAHLEAVTQRENLARGTQWD